MHPLTLYDMAVSEHVRATAQRSRAHQLALRRRERSTTRRASRAASRSARPATT